MDCHSHCSYVLCIIYYLVISYLALEKKSVSATEGRLAILMSSLCLESQGCQFDPTFLLSPFLFFCQVLLLLLLFCFWPILLTPLSVNVHCPCVALVFVVLSGLEMSTLAGGMCIICCHMVLVLAFMQLYSIFNLQLFLLIVFYNYYFFYVVLERHIEMVSGTSIS